MTRPKNIFLLVVFAVVIAAMNIALPKWNQLLKAADVRYIKDTTVQKIAFDGQGRVWTYEGEWRAGNLNVYKDGVLIQTVAPEDSLISGADLWVMKADKQGRIWVAPRENIGIDLAVFDGTNWSVLLPVPGSDPFISERVRISSIAFDRQGRAWIGTEGTQGGNHGYGLYIIDGDIWEHYTTDNSGLLSNNVNCIAFDDQGRAWIGTWNGLNVFDGKVWQQTLTTKNLNRSNYIVIGGGPEAIVFDQQGRAWIANGTALEVFDGEKWTKYPNLSSAGFSDIAVDSQGRVWAMEKYDQGILVFDGKLKKYYFDPFHYRVPDDWPGETNDFAPGEMIAADINGNIWIPNANGVVIIPPNSSQPISYAAGILSIVITSNGLVYLAALLIIVWLCVALNAWRSIGFSLLGLPIYFGLIIYANGDLGYASFRQFNTYAIGINPGTIVTICGVIGGAIDILLARWGSTKRTRWGLAGVIIGLGLSFCLLTINILAAIQG